jgi:hypothetical protein
MIADRDLHEAMASLEKIKPTGQPESDKRMVDYLTSLTKGANPKIPEVMALAQLQAFQKAMSQKPATAPPQGTIRDKAVQSAGIMALQGGRQQQAAQQMAQAAPQSMAVPENVPQPQMQPQLEEDVQMAARGGLMQAKIDPRMFEFTHGGIVSFSGEDQSYVDLDRIRAEAEDAANKLRTYGLRQRKEDPQGYDAAVKRAEEAKAAIRAKEREITGGPAGAMRQSMGAGPAPSAPVIPQTPDRPPTSTDEVNAMIGVPPAGGSAPPPPPPPPAAGGPRPPAGPRPAGSTGIAQALPPELEAMRPRDNPDYKRLLEQSQGVSDAYGRTVETQRTKAERPLIDSARELQETRKQLGIGDYANTLEKNRAEEKREYEEAKKKREDKELNAMLNAMFKPGFKRGDISLARQEKLKEFEEADKTFTAAQRQSLTEIAKYKESLAIGDLKEASDSKKEAEKGLITMAGKLAELKLGTFEQAIAYLKYGDNKSMEFNKAVLGFKQHRDDMAQKYSLQREALRERALQNKRAYDQRNDQLNFQYAKANVAAHNPELKSLAAKENMIAIQRDVALKNKDFEKADSFQEQLDTLQTQRANIMLPIAGRAEGSGGITGAPGAAASQGKMPAGVTVTRQPS